MTEDRAAYYQAHKDDPDLFGEEEESPVPKNSKMSIDLTVRFTADEANDLYRLASIWKCSYSEAVKSALRLAVEARVSNLTTDSQTWTGNVRQPNIRYSRG